MRASSIAGVASVAGAAVLGRAWARYRRAEARALAQLETSAQSRLGDIGDVDSVTILPLVERHTAGPEFLGEPGASYLITAGGETLLFDTGLNAGRKQRKVLASNAGTLGVDLERIDAVVISHLHVDHVGGVRAARAGTFTFGPDIAPLSGIPAFAPVGMRHDRADVRVTQGPTVIASGVALLPPLLGPLFWLAPLEEQALVVNVRGLGLVLISGCGHPGIGQMLALTERVLDIPVHAVVGGLHLPLHPSGTYWVPATLAAPRPPWQPLNDADVDAAVEHVRARRPARVAVSGHDSTPSVLTRFADAFGESYEEVVVGRPITIGVRSTGSP